MNTSQKQSLNKVKTEFAICGFRVYLCHTEAEEQAKGRFFRFFRDFLRITKSNLIFSPPIVVQNKSDFRHFIFGLAGFSCSFRNGKLNNL